jgi:hypothetical protein
MNTENTKLAHTAAGKELFQKCLISATSLNAKNADISFLIAVDHVRIAGLT